MFAVGSMLVLGLAVGCDKPMDGIPNSGGSAISSGDDIAVEMPIEDKVAPPLPGHVAPPIDVTPVPAIDPVPAVDPAPAVVPAPEVDPAATTDPAPATDPVPADEPPKVENPAAPGDDAKQSAAGNATSAKLVSKTNLKVPTMTCPSGCWPTVKETLAAQPGVESVELAKQASEDAIDNPVVHVKLNGKFDSKAAVEALAKAGFENAKVVN